MMLLRRTEEDCDPVLDYNNEHPDADEDELVELVIENTEDQEYDVMMSTKTYDGFSAGSSGKPLLFRAEKEI